MINSFQLEVYQFNSSTFFSRDQSRARLGFYSASVDFGLAFAMLLERCNVQKAQAILTYKFKNSALMEILKLNNTPLRTLLGGGAMFLTAVVSFMDAAYYYDLNNPAWMGYAMSGVGASFLTLQAFAPIIFASMGWFVFGTALLLLGAYLVYKLDNSDKLKEWFDVGPFAKRSNSSYSHLQGKENRSEALYRLVSLLLQFDVQVKKIDKQQATKLWQQSLIPSSTLETEEQRQQRAALQTTYAKEKDADLKIQVRCLCSNLLTGCEFIPHMVRYRYQGNFGLGVYETIEQLETYAPEKLTNMMAAHPQGLDIYLKQGTSSITGTTKGSVMINNNSYLFKMQIKASYTAKGLVNEKNYNVFPAPPVAGNRKFNDPSSNNDHIPSFPTKDYHINLFTAKDFLTKQNFWFEKYFFES